MGLAAKNKRKLNVKLALIIFFTLFVSQETILFGTNSDLRFFNFGLAVYLLLAGLCVLKINKRRFKGKSWLFAILLLILLSMIMNFDVTGGVLLQMSSIIIGAYIASTNSLDDFLKTFEQLFYYLSWASIGVYVLYIIVPGFFAGFPIITVSTGPSYIFTGVGNIDTRPLGVLRNMSFFREPGMFAVFLTFATSVCLFYYDRLPKKHLIVYIVATITTISTAGYVLMLLLLLVYFLSKRSFKYSIILSFFLLFLLILYQNLKDEMIFLDTFGKFDSDSDKYLSTVSRLASFTVPLYIIAEKPFFGACLTESVNSFMRISRVLYHSEIDPAGNATNTILGITAAYGIPIGVLFFNMLYRFARRLLNRKVPRIVVFSVFVLLFLALSNEDIRYSIFFSAMLFYGIDSNVYKNK